MDAAVSFIKETTEGTLLSFLPKDILDMLPEFLLTREYYKYGKISEIYFSKAHHILEGEYVMYYSNGKIQSKSYYKDGKQEGESTHWSIDGTFVSRCFYKNGKMHGNHTIYNPDGTVLSEHMFKNGHSQCVIS
jgi:antitoxin component YwqK of YwqJK toxin-antitoxin module